MRRVSTIGLVVVCLAFLLPSPPTSAAAGDLWKAGTASAKITPQQSMWLAGYGGRNHPSEGTLHDLWIKVLALEAPDGHRGVVLTSDLLGLSQGMYERIVAELGRTHGLRPDQLMLTASHTHTGPVLQEALYDIYPLDDQQRTRIEKYSSSLEKTITATVAKALGQMTPAVLSAAEGTCPLAVNRRNNREKLVAELRKKGAQLKGPVDHTVPVLAVKSPQGKLRAIVFSYACHATTLSSYEWSGDYPGFAQLALAKRFPDAQAMFYAGCGADQNPLPRRSVELCQKYGEMVAESVAQVLSGPMRPVAPALRTAAVQIELPFERNPTRAELEETAKRRGYAARWANRLLGEMDAGRPMAPGSPYPVQAWRLGNDQLWIALGGEVVVDYPLMLKKTYGPTTWTAGYTGHVMAYIPSRRIWEEGGYEAGAFMVYGLPALRWKEDVQQRVTAAVESLVKQVRKP